jgi:hypothetical protein
LPAQDWLDWLLSRYQIVTSTQVDHKPQALLPELHCQEDELFAYASNNS